MLNIRNLFIIKMQFIKMAVPSHERESVVHMGVGSVEIVSVSANFFY